MTLWLVGMMGSGKTTVGELLAAQLRVPFYDSDRAVEARAGTTIAGIWEREGEDRFRLLESAEIAELATSEQGVVATGGGAVLDPSNRDLMRSSGTVVWLRSSVEGLLERLGEGGSRPLLGGDDPAMVLTDILAAREDIYREISDVVVDVDGRTPQSIAEEVGRIWKI